MKGFVIFNNQNGNLVYSRYFNAKLTLSKEAGFKNLTFDQQDPHKIAAMFFSLIKITNIMAEEYKEEYPDDVDPFTKLAFEQSFTGMKSDSVDYVLQHHDEFSLSIVVFYDIKEVQESITRFFAERVMDIFVQKKEKILRQGGPNM